ncbi:MAG: CDP-diacylglycerol--serine O-phosphatidyltransferase [Bacteroidia bacterium]
MKRHIPNTLTLLNLACGVLAILFIVQDQLDYCIVALGLSLAFDFLDGMVARLLKVSSPIGKELDSLADMVSFGVVPGLIMARLILETQGEAFPPESLASGNFLWFAGVLVAMFSGMRLAKFNVDTRQSDSFIGVPTPANTLLILSFWIIVEKYPDNFLNGAIQNTWFLVGMAVLLSYLLVSELPLIALKFKTWSFGPNRFRYILIGASLLLFGFLSAPAIPFIILLYICLSIIQLQFVKD